MATAKRLGLQFCGTAILFSAFVSLTTSGVLLLACVLGYLPYSDRPGPGWWGRVHWPSPAEIGTYLGFAPWFAYFCWSALSGEGQQIEVAVIALQPIDREYSVELPSGGHVVYVLHDERLEPHPAFTKKDKRTIILKPGVDSKWSGGQIKDCQDFSPFTWDPTIPR